MLETRMFLQYNDNGNHVPILLPGVPVKGETLWRGAEGFKVTARYWDIAEKAVFICVDRKRR